MGNSLSGEGLEGGRNVGRQQAVTEGKRRQRTLPHNAARSTPEDWPFIEVEQLQPGDSKAASPSASSR